MKGSLVWGRKKLGMCPSGSCLSGGKGKKRNTPGRGSLLFPWVCRYLYKKEARLPMGPFFLLLLVAQQHCLVQTGVIYPAASSGATTAPSVPPISRFAAVQMEAARLLQEAGSGHEAIRHQQAARQLPGLWKRGRENRLFCCRSLKQSCQAGTKGSSGLK